MLMTCDGLESENFPVTGRYSNPTADHTLQREAPREKHPGRREKDSEFAL